MRRRLPLATASTSPGVIAAPVSRDVRLCAPGSEMDGPRTGAFKNLDIYLRDPLCQRMWSEIRSAGVLKAISVDITHSCNIRCEGCYFFGEDMDQKKTPRDEAEFDAFVDSEVQRGTNFVTIIGGEPSLMKRRVKKLHDRFWVMCVTNGLVAIPVEGFETMPIMVSVWGDPDADKKLRGAGKVDVFGRGLKNYKNDPRVHWYFTVAAGNAAMVERVVEACVQNGNRVLFNFYGDIDSLGAELDHRHGFGAVRAEVDRMIEVYPDRIWTTSYLSQVISTGRLFDERWGYDVCGSITADNPINAARIQNDHPYSTHFRAYAPDLRSTRRCCVGDERDCATCFDTWAHFSWIMIHLDKHLGSAESFFNWLSTIYVFYSLIRAIDHDQAVKLLPEIHRRQASLRARPQSTVAQPTSSAAHAS